MGGGKGLVSQVCYPVTELVVTRRDEVEDLAGKAFTSYHVRNDPLI